MAERVEHTFSVTWRMGGPGDPLLTARADLTEELAERMPRLELVVREHLQTALPATKPIPEEKRAEYEANRPEDETAVPSRPAGAEGRYRIMAAKFSGECAGCSAPIQKGEEIRYDTQTRKAYCHPKHKQAEG